MIRTVGSLESDDCCELHLAKEHQELNKSIFKTTYQKELKYAPIKTENQEKSVCYSRLVNRLPVHPPQKTLLKVPLEVM